MFLGKCRALGTCESNQLQLSLKPKVPQILHCLRMLDTSSSFAKERPGFVESNWGAIFFLGISHRFQVVGKITGCIVPEIRSLDIVIR